MKLLKLMGLHLGPYKGVFVNKEFKETTVNAYVYYTNYINGKDEACDDKGKAIGTFMNANDRTALESMVNNKVKPVIDKGLLGSDYHVSGIDYTNMAPHPHLVIARRDNMPLTENDVTAIQQRVETAIDAKNKAVISSGTKRINNMFNAVPEENKPKAAKKTNKRDAESMSEAEQIPQSRYNLRKRG